MVLDDDGDKTHTHVIMIDVPFYHSIRLSPLSLCRARCSLRLAWHSLRASFLLRYLGGGDLHTNGNMARLAINVPMMVHHIHAYSGLPHLPPLPRLSIFVCHIIQHKGL